MRAFCGSVAERLNAPVLKTGVGKPIVSSNLTGPAISHCNKTNFPLVFGGLDWLGQAPGKGVGRNNPNIRYAHRFCSFGILEVNVPLFRAGSGHAGQRIHQICVVTGATAAQAGIDQSVL
jgi:hypothetical protein